MLVSVVGLSKGLLLIIMAMVTIVTCGAEVIGIIGIFHFHRMTCCVWSGIVPSPDGNYIVMRDLSSVTWFKVVDDDILALKFYAISPTCDSFISFG